MDFKSTYEKVQQMKDKMVQMQRISESDNLIIGPSQSSKTTTTAVLQLASLYSQSSANYPCTVFPKNKPMIELIAHGMSIIEHGHSTIDASNDICHYKFNFRVEVPSSNGKKKVHQRNFTLPDSPGEALLPSVQDAMDAACTALNRQYRRQLIKQLKQARSLIMMIDSTDEESARNYFKNLITLLNEIGTGKLKITRVVILLTKADKYFSKYGKDALKMALETPPQHRARELFTLAALMGLKSYLPARAQIVCGWSSIYGFIPESGLANYDSKSDGLLSFNTNDSHAKRIDSWRPFRLTDAFVFITTGELNHLKPIEHTPEKDPEKVQLIKHVS